MKKPKNITIVGRRWFDKINGNTYHSVSVVVDGVVVGHEPFAYGYGDGYIQTAGDILKKTTLTLPKYPNGVSQTLWKYCQENEIKLNCFVADVGRRRDL